VTLARRAWAEVVYQGKDISADLQPYLLGVSYTDHQGGKADEVSIDLQDRNALWRGDWLPGQGDTLQVRIHADEWGEGGGTLFCGTFTLDKLGLAGPPSTVKLSGVSVPTGLAARKTKRSRAWENASLQTIAGDVAASARMPLIFDAADTPPLDRVDQRSETDLAFLARLCGERHYALKVTDNQLVVWSIADYGARPEFTTYTLGESRVLSWSLDVKAYLYTPKVKVVYQDPWWGVPQQSTVAAAEALRGNAEDDPLGLQQQSFDDAAAEVIRQRARSKAEAEAKAKAALLARTEHSAEGSLTVVGDVRLVAGNTVRLAGWNKLDGKYLVEKAEHSLRQGYTVRASIKRATP
jgi:phage protein D